MSTTWYRLGRAFPVLVVLIPACEAPAPDTDAQTVDETAGSAAPAAEMVDALRESYVQAYNARDMARVAELYAADAILISPGGVARGREAIRAVLAGDPAGRTTVTSGGIGTSGGLTYDWGTYAIAGMADVPGGEARGDYMAVSRLQNGQARLVVLMTGTPQAPEQDTEQGGVAVEEVDNVSAAFISAYNAGDLTAVARLYADAAVLITQNGVFRGPAEIEEGFFAGHVEGIRLSATHLGEGEAGGAVWRWGRYRMSNVPAPPGIRAGAYYLMLFDDEGRIAAHMTGSPRQTQQMQELERQRAANMA